MDKRRAFDEMRGQIAMVRHMTTSVIDELDTRLENGTLFESGDEIAKVIRGMKNYVTELEQLKRLDDVLSGKTDAAA